MISCTLADNEFAYKMHIDMFVGVDVKTKAHFRIIASQGFLNFSIYSAKLLLLCVVLFLHPLTGKLKNS